MRTRSTGLAPLPARVVSSLASSLVPSLALRLTLSLLLSLVALGCSKQSPSGAPPPSQPAAASQPAPADPAAAPAEPAPSEPAPVDAGALDPKPAGEELADCDVSKVRCRRMPPQCKEGEVATASGSCFGECVAIERCRCSTSVACPQTDKYTCWHNKHCGPYVR